MNTPEYDTYIPYVGENERAHEGRIRAAFKRLATCGTFGGWDLDMYLKGVDGTKFLCKIMKYLVQTGVTPQFISNKLTDVADADDDNKAEFGCDVTDFIRKIIAGAFAVRTYDLRLLSSGSSTTRLSSSHRSNCTDLRGHWSSMQGPCGDYAGSQQDWPGYASRTREDLKNKMKSSKSSEAQLEYNIKSLDPADRDGAREYVRAIKNALDTAGQGSSAASNQAASKCRRSGWRFIIEEGYWERHESRKCTA